MQTSVNKSIRASQTGYQASERKLAVLALDGAASGEAASDAVIRRVGDEYPMLLAPIGAPDVDTETGETLRRIDFSALREAGTYFIDVPGYGRSEAFEIIAE